MSIFPQNTHRTFISISLAPGSRAEPDITNKEYLDSFLEYSCWIRLLSARKHLQILESKGIEEIERLAALASFSQLSAQITEDALTTYIAWSVWAVDKSKSLPNVFERLSLRMSSPTKPLPEDYVSQVQLKITDTVKRVDVYPREYLSLILRENDANLPRSLGIPWKKQPSVKLVSPEQRPFWDGMGGFIRGSVQPLIDSKGALLASTYNKIKHGPQMIVMQLRQALERRGLPVPDQETGQRQTVRLLLQGARVQEHAEEFASNTRCAPFLVDDVANVRRWFYQQMVHQVNSMYVLGTWLFNTTYMDEKRAFPPTSSAVQELVRAQSRHFGDT